MNPKPQPKWLSQTYYAVQADLGISPKKLKRQWNFILFLERKSRRAWAARIDTVLEGPFEKLLPKPVEAAPVRLALPPAPIKIVKEG